MNASATSSKNAERVESVFEPVDHIPAPIYYRYPQGTPVPAATHFYDPEPFLRQRRNLIASSLGVILFYLAGADPTGMNVMGLGPVKHIWVLKFSVFLMVGYFWIRFKIYGPDQINALFALEVFSRDRDPRLEPLCGAANVLLRPARGKQPSEYARMRSQSSYLFYDRGKTYVHVDPQEVRDDLRELFDGGRPCFRWHTQKLRWYIYRRLINCALRSPSFSEFVLPQILMGFALLVAFLYEVVLV